METPEYIHDDLPLPRGVKFCTKCEQNFPYSAFDRDSGKPDGFRSHCKECRRRARVDDDGVPLALRAIEQRSLEILESLDSTGGSTLPHTSEVVEEWFKAIGGPVGWVKLMLGQYAAAKPGGQERGRLIQSINYMVMKVSESGHATPKLEHMTDAELQAMIERENNVAVARRIAAIETTGKQVMSIDEVKELLIEHRAQDQAREVASA